VALQEQSVFWQLTKVLMMSFTIISLIFERFNFIVMGVAVDVVPFFLSFCHWLPLPGKFQDWVVRVE
jgi:hypothetical protein